MIRVGFLLLAVSVTSSRALSEDERVNSVRAHIRRAIKGSYDGHRYTVLPNLVRLVFHDCVGGCDGCVDMSNPSNAGLDKGLAVTKKLWLNPAVRFLSKADLFALIGIEAVLFAARLACTKRPLKTCVLPDMPFRRGRIDCDPDNLPWREFKYDAHGDLDHVLTFFRNTFGLSHRETVASLGAHTLGRARREFSGYDGPWVSQEDVLDNQFYIDMISASIIWTQVNINAGTDLEARWQWMKNNELPPGSVADSIKYVNVDYVLWKDCKIKKGGEATIKSSDECPESATAEMVRDFALNNDKWLREFGAVFTKIIENGYSAGELKALS